MASKTTSSAPSKRAAIRKGGFTLVELLIATVIGAMVMTAVAALISYTARSFASLGNYSDLNHSSLRALNYLVRDVRGARSVTSSTTNQITFNMGLGKPALTYAYSATGRTLTRTEGADSRFMLTDCDSLKFALYQRTPISGTYDQYPLADKATCKVVTVDWTCTKVVLGKMRNTQHSQTAKIVMRKA